MLLSAGGQSNIPKSSRPNPKIVKNQALRGVRLTQLNAKIRPEDIPPLTTIKKGRPFRRPVKPDVLCGLIQAYCFHSPPSGPNQVLFSKNCTWPKTDRPIYKKTNFKLISGAERALRTTSRSPRIRCRKHSALSRTSDKTCLGL